jgi:D-arabinose 1-dehydrogenase-like Zn-dependent alcohol dehydrogenase
VLTDFGCYLNTSGTVTAIATTVMSAVFARLTSRQRAIPIALRNGPPMWHRLLQLTGSGVLRPHIAKTIGLDQVAGAMREMETGHGRGKIAVRIA